MYYYYYCPRQSYVQPVQQHQPVHPVQPQQCSIQQGMEACNRLKPLPALKQLGRRPNPPEDEPEFESEIFETEFEDDIEQRAYGSKAKGSKLPVSTHPPAPQLTTEQRCMRQTQRNAELCTIKSKAPGCSCNSQNTIGRFIDLYLQAELLGRKIQTWYFQDNSPDPAIIQTWCTSPATFQFKPDLKVLQCSDNTVIPKTIPYIVPHGQDMGGVTVKTLTEAFKYYKIVPDQMDENVVKWVFAGGSGIPGQKSVRQLRNGYFHSLAESDKNEILNQADSLFQILEELLEVRLMREPWPCPPSQLF